MNAGTAMLHVMVPPNLTLGEYRHRNSAMLQARFPKDLIGFIHSLAL